MDRQRYGLFYNLSNAFKAEQQQAMKLKKRQRAQWRRQFVVAHILKNPHFTFQNKVMALECLHAQHRYSRVTSCLLQDRLLYELVKEGLQFAPLHKGLYGSFLIILHSLFRSTSVARISFDCLLLLLELAVRIYTEWPDRFPQILCALEGVFVSSKTTVFCRDPDQLPPLKKLVVDSLKKMCFRFYSYTTSTPTHIMKDTPNTSRLLNVGLRIFRLFCSMPMSVTREFVEACKECAVFVYFFLFADMQPSAAFDSVVLERVKLLHQNFPAKLDTNRVHKGSSEKLFWVLWRGLDRFYQTTAVKNPHLFAKLRELVLSDLVLFVAIHPTNREDQSKVVCLLENEADFIMQVPQHREKMADIVSQILRYLLQEPYKTSTNSYHMTKFLYQAKEKSEKLGSAKGFQIYLTQTSMDKFHYICSAKQPREFVMMWTQLQGIRFGDLDKPGEAGLKIEEVSRQLFFDRFARLGVVQFSTGNLSFIYMDHIQSPIFRFSVLNRYDNIVRVDFKKQSARYIMNLKNRSSNQGLIRLFCFEQAGRLEKVLGMLQKGYLEDKENIKLFVLGTKKLCLNLNVELLKQNIQTKLMRSRTDGFCAYHSSDSCLRIVRLRDKKLFDFKHQHHIDACLIFDNKVAVTSHHLLNLFQFTDRFRSFGSFEVLIGQIEKLLFIPQKNLLLLFPEFGTHLGIVDLTGLAHLGRSAVKLFKLFHSGPKSIPFALIASPHDVLLVAQNQLPGQRQIYIGRLHIS